MQVGTVRNAHRSHREWVPRETLPLISGDAPHTAIERTPSQVFALCLRPILFAWQGADAEPRPIHPGGTDANTRYAQGSAPNAMRRTIAGSCISPVSPFCSGRVYGMASRKRHYPAEHRPTPRFTRRCPSRGGAFLLLALKIRMERVIGLEPTTFCLGSRHSTN